jgi:hypothetical protein
MLGSVVRHGKVDDTTTIVRYIMLNTCKEVKNIFQWIKFVAV